VALLAGAASGAPIPKAKEKTTEEKLAGKWKLVKTDAKFQGNYEFLIEYKPKGEMVFYRNFMNGQSLVSEGKYKVLEGEKIDWTVNENGNERGEVSKIKTLTAEKLVIEDPEGIKEEFEKVVDKKDEKKEDKKKDEPKKDEPKKDE
jgi:uncharacterized protein (TIGR03066 family)